MGGAVGECGVFVVVCVADGLWCLGCEECVYVELCFVVGNAWRCLFFVRQCGVGSVGNIVVRRQRFGYSKPRRLGAAAVRLLEATAAGCGGSGSAATARSTKPIRET